MSYKIVIHSGKAHMDELLASALLRLHRGEPPEEVERIFPEEAAKRVREGHTGGNTYYLDCGLGYDPEKNLFDHHQDRELDSAAFLVLKHFFPHLKGTDLYRYIELISRVDNEGPKSLNDFDVIDESRFYFSMGQKLMLKAFEA
ncbi:MAG: MYG1 family protein, partial [Spirochaetales bacterium]|nr:MYG1 family protein [Spirochaetales bacterium]